MSDESITSLTDDQQHNPYAVSEPSQPIAASQSEDERLRYQYLNHEASVLTLGVIYVVGAIGVGVSAVVGIVTAQTFVGPIPRGKHLSWNLSVVGLAVLLGLIGVQIWRLKPAGQKVALALSGPALVLFPIGTAAGALSLYLLSSAAGRTVFSKPYRHAVSVTPHIKYRISRRKVALLVVPVLAVIAVLAVAANVLG